MWQNENAFNDFFHALLTERANGDQLLRDHRNWIERHGYGFGDRAFHYVWKMLVDEMTSDFRFLEIGVFRGQVLSLISLLASASGKRASVHGVTPLNNRGDYCCTYPESDYLQDIKTNYDAFNLPNDYQLICGNSDDPNVISSALSRYYSIVYIDGGHDYTTVASDIKSYGSVVPSNGYLVMDDSSNFLNIGKCWAGIKQVSEAVRDVLEADRNFKHIFACGHLRVFRRL